MEVIAGSSKQLITLGKLPARNNGVGETVERTVWVVEPHHHRLKTLIMLGISQISKEVNKKSKIGNEETTKRVLNAFLEVAKEKIIHGESLNFKSYFTIKRSVAKQKGSKNCDEHQKELDKFKQTNKGKGIAAYTKSNVFRNLVAKTRNCAKCKAKKQQLAKSAKLTNRVSFKVSKEFWKPAKGGKTTKRR